MRLSGFNGFDELNGVFAWWGLEICRSSELPKRAHRMLTIVTASMPPNICFSMHFSLFEPISPVLNAGSMAAAEQSEPGFPLQDAFPAAPLAQSGRCGNKGWHDIPAKLPDKLFCGQRRVDEPSPSHSSRSPAKSKGRRHSSKR